MSFCRFCYRSIHAICCLYMARMSSIRSADWGLAAMLLGSGFLLPGSVPPASISVAINSSQHEMLESLREQQKRGRVAPAEARRVAKLPKPVLQNFIVESYLDVFERVAAQPEWPKETWATQIAGLLSGDALDSYSSLIYRQRFRTEIRKPTESYMNFSKPR